MNDDERAARQDYPGRPDHPDFWALSEVVIDMDAEADKGAPFDEMVGDIDERSLVYMAQQRALRTILQTRMPTQAQAAMAALWIDAFVVGRRFAERRDDADERPQHPHR